MGLDTRHRSKYHCFASTQDGRPHWNIKQPPDYHVMPRKFAFTATEELGELQLGGYDPASVAQPMQMFPMAVRPRLPLPCSSPVLGSPAFFPPT